jgi:hypothetical protein
MALFFGRKKPEATVTFDPNPGTRDTMPERPYRVLYADLDFFSDPECKAKVEGACLVVLQSEDPKQKHQIQECMPTRKKYQVGQLVEWDLDNKRILQNCWYRNPQTGKAEKAWVQAVEFIGRVVSRH